MSVEDLERAERTDACLELAHKMRNALSCERGLIMEAQATMGEMLRGIQKTMDGLQAMMDEARARIQLIDPAGSFEIRSDPAGDGRYGASRGGRTHQGLDTRADPGDSARAPMTGLLVRSGLCYRDDDRFSLAVIESEPWACKVLYVAPYARLIGRRVRMGQIIGMVQDVTKRKDYAVQGMMPHVHTEVRHHGEIVDPTPLMGLCHA